MNSLRSGIPRSALMMANEPIEKTVRLEAGALLEGIQSACQRVVSMDGSGVSVTSTDTAYVLDGRTFTVQAYDGPYRFWCGTNNPRLFWICHMQRIDVEKAREAFRFCFGGAEKAGWNVNYERLTDGSGVSIWATCITDRERPLCVYENDINGAAAASMTAEGVYWATDIAMMVQSWIRTSQRFGFSCHPGMPAPL